MSFEELDQLLDKAISLFRFLQDKDLFEKYYKQHLAKRLLLGKIESEDVERQMLAKLKVLSSSSFFFFFFSFFFFLMSLN